MRTMTSSCLVGLVVFLGPAAHAVEKSFTVPTSADWEFVLVEDGPLWQALVGLGVSPPTGALPFRALGDATFTYDDTGAPDGGSVPVTAVSALFDDADPSPPLFRPFTLSPEVEFFGGSLSNIVRDNGEIVMADVNISMDFTLVPQVPNPLAGVNFFTDGGLTFNAVAAPIPFTPGTHLSLMGDDRFNVYQGPDPDPAVIDPASLSAIGQNRTLTAVPEPAGVGLLSLGAVLLLLRRKQR